jgi:ribosomal protein S18 acetylase RimI-like enzyme
LALLATSLLPRLPKKTADSQIKKRSFGILSIAVSPSHQRCGLGRLLIETSEKAAREAGIYEMHLSVEVDNQKAVRFYEKLGWEKVPSNDPTTITMKKSIQRDISAYQSMDLLE